MVIRYLNGNTLSFLTNYLTTDGENEWQERDEEFDNII